jgi:hypothetical protein
MVKQAKFKVTSPKLRSKPSGIDDFMRSSMISPKYEYYNSNTNSSFYPQSHVPHTSHIDEHEDVYDKTVSYNPTKYSEDYTSSSSTSSDEESNIVATPIHGDSYANATREKDMKIYRMKNLLYNKRKIMFDKEREIKELGEQNTFLETVIDDYKKYNISILEEKIKQKRALKILSDHIRKISKNIKNDEFKLNRVKMDQTALLEEIQNIRDEIAYVLNSTGNNTSYVSSDDELQYEDDSDKEYYEN